jgi:transcriptional regulator with XRE-family HTH domain
MRGNHLIREARKRAGLSQVELAERAGTTQSVISRLERGATTPSLQTISQLVRACRFDLDVHLGPAVDDEWQIVQQNLRLSPTARVRQLTRTVEFIRRGRDAMGHGKRA